MAGTMRKMAVYLGLVEDDLDGEYQEEEAQPRARDQYLPSASESRPRPAAEPAPVAPARVSVQSATATALADRPAPAERPAPAVVSPIVSEPAPPLAQSTAPVQVVRAAAAAPTSTMRATGQALGTDTYRITTLHPRSYNDARTIGEEYREGVPVVINLTEMDDKDAKRIIDFAAGLIFGLRGSLERITNKVFLLSPANVDVGAEARAQVAKDGFFNQS